MQAIGGVLAMCQLAVALRLNQAPFHLPSNAPERLYLNISEFFVTKSCKDLGAAPMCQAQPGMGNFSAHAVISTWRDDLTWLNEMPWNDGMTVFVHDRSKKRSHVLKTEVSKDAARAEESEVAVKALNPKRNVPVDFEDIPNKGGEASAYLSWIIRKYKKLPDVVFFLKGHRCAQNAPFDMSVALPSIRQCFRREEGYLNLNSYAGHAGATCMPSVAILNRTKPETKNLHRIWTYFFMEEYGGPMPTRMCWDDYAQFAVTRERILSHPVSFYKKLFKAVVNGNTTMEFFWRPLFVPAATSWEPLPEKETDYQFTGEELRENHRHVDMLHQKVQYRGFAQ